MFEGGGNSAAVGMAATLDGIAAASSQRSAAENFPVALRILPRGPRRHLMRLYAFARFVDDVGDEADGDRLALLDLIEQDVRRLWTGQPELAPVAGLMPVKAYCSLPIEPLLDLIEANRLDQTVNRYDSFDDLLAYCRLSAAPIGRLVLAVAGVGDEKLLPLADSICAALQVLEHCQDIAEDARAGRVYLPATDLAAAAVAEADLTAASASTQLREVIARQVARARTLLTEGRPLINRLHGWPRFAVAGYLAGGLATANALESAGYDVLSAPVRPGRLRTLVAATRVLAGR
jgi:squalene synthase HpnC